MSSDRQNELALYCWAYVAGAFADFIEISNRGVNFTWNKFNGSFQATEMILHRSIAKPVEVDFIKSSCNEIALSLKDRAGFK